LKWLLGLLQSAHANGTKNPTVNFVGKNGVKPDYSGKDFSAGTKESRGKKGRGKNKGSTTDPQNQPLIRKTWRG